MTSHPPTQEHLKMHLELTGWYFVSAGAALLFGLPLSLLAADGAWRAVGIIYASLWMVAFLPSAAAFLWMTFDSCLIIFNRQPVLLTRMLVSQQQWGRRPSRRIVRALRAFARVAIWINPLGNIALAASVVAVRLRPQLFAQS